MNPSKSEGMKIGLAGMTGCLLALMFVWWWSGNMLVVMLSLPIGFLAGWVAYAPVAFFATWPHAWRRATSWRPSVMDRVMIRQVSAISFFLANIGLLVSLVPLLVMYLNEVQVSWLILWIAPSVGLLLLTLGTISTIMMAAGDIEAEKIEAQLDEARRLWHYAIRFNAPTILFYWLPWCLIKGLIRIPATVVATLRGFVTFFNFTLRFARALAEITASNGRLTSGLAAVIGTIICFSQNWPPVPGCLVGGVAGFALWGLAVLVLRYLPAPRQITAVA